MNVSKIKHTIRKNIPYFTKYINSGLLSMGVDYLVLFILTNYFGMFYIYSVTFSYLSGFITNFYLNKYWTFKKKDDTKTQFIKYSALVAFNFVVTLTLMYLLTSNMGINYLISRGLVLFSIICWNYLIYKHFIYK
ncbi:GtrA family protein [archaeon]|jgi:putative flippase GtrA|nr:GtrA family protein [archaeon]MBT3451337.1 GtrA family protein [archaeon]MBT6869347.1 GtrA family protein [archaeon]MBT7192510.1 GtrA family protein [archaeon]MBT7380586.1 GtrA family protein [archaeon]